MVGLGTVELDGEGFSCSPREEVSRARRLTQDHLRPLGPGGAGENVDWSPPASFSLTEHFIEPPFGQPLFSPEACGVSQSQSRVLTWLSQNLRSPSRCGALNPSLFSDGLIVEGFTDPSQNTVFQMGCKAPSCVSKMRDISSFTCSVFFSSPEIPPRCQDVSFTTFSPLTFSV